MQLLTGFYDSCKEINIRKHEVFKTILNFSLFAIHKHQKQSEQMIREIERIFESLKEDFNEKVGSFNYFTKISDSLESHIANAGGSISDSYEDISMVADIEKEENFKSKIVVFKDEEFDSVLIQKPEIEIITNISPKDESEMIFDHPDIPDSEIIENVSTKPDANDEFTEEVNLNTNIVEHENPGFNFVSENENTEIMKSFEIDEDITNIPNNEIECENEFVSNDTIETNFETDKISVDSENNTVFFIGDEKNIRILTNSNKNDEIHDVKLGNVLVEIEKIKNREIIEQLPDEEDTILNELETNDENQKDEEVFLYKNSVEDSSKSSEINDDCVSDLKIINEIFVGENELHNDINDGQSENPIKESENLNNVIISISDSHSQIIEKEDLIKADNDLHQKTHKSDQMRKQSLNININRRMWSNMPEVISSGILTNFPKKKLQYQEAMFEIITSESSYYQSLMILTKHFFQSDLFSTSENKETIVSATDKHHIFSNVILIMKTSNNLLKDLQQRWHDEKPVMSDICDIILNHAISDDFQSYVTYLRNQQYQTQALKRLSENEYFKQQLHKLESSSECGKLSLDSYLMVPMQRLTRLKLLVEAVSKLQNSEELSSEISQSIKNKALEALEVIKQLLNTSNTEKGFMDQKSALISLINRIDFPPNSKRITFSDKVLVREEELRVHQQTQVKTQRKISKKNKPLLTLLLFNDLLIITKKKNGRLLVLDYCDTKYIKVESTLFRRNASSNEASSNTSAIDISTESSSPIRSIGPTLMRSKTSLTGDERKRLSVPLNNSFASMPSINKNEVQETKNQTFKLQLMNSFIFTDPIYLTTRSREDRDWWLSYFNVEDQCDGQSKQNSSKLQKSTSLMMKTNYDDSISISKSQSFKKRSDE